MFAIILDYYNTVDWFRTKMIVLCKGFYLFFILFFQLFKFIVIMTHTNNMINDVYYYGDT